MSEPDLLSQADALIGRHRAAGEAGPEAARADDLPVLTEIVALAASRDGADDATTAARRAALREALAQELETWLDQHLPGVVLRVLDGLSDQLIDQVARQARLELLPRLKGTLDAPPEDDSGHV